MSQLRQQETRLKELEIQVYVVTFDADFMAIAYLNEIGLPWPLLLDSQQSLYRDYGMAQGSWWSLYGVPSIWKYLKLIGSGRWPGRPGKDWSQLGGDVLIDPQGIVRFHYVSTGPHDRPAVESLMAVVESKHRSC